MTHHCLRRQALRVPLSDTAQFLVLGRRYVTSVIRRLLRAPLGH